MARLRQNVARLADWDPTIEWYALAIRELQTRAPNVTTSWRYLGAIHGFNYNTWINSSVITGADPLPPKSEWDGPAWNQCQHGSWYFLPWHRGYLAAFEAIVGQVVADLGGPADWALPYWNYFDEGNPNARQYPPAFVAPTLPDGSANPLSAPPRSTATAIGPVPWHPGDISLAAMNETQFTASPLSIGFGGGVTAFSHFGNASGALELDPHNAVHVIIGGRNGGFMFDPDLAGLDPVFWLHHCNIDRLWAAWLARPGKVQEASAAWTDGPSPRAFVMPDPTGALIRFTPGDTLPEGSLAPTYDDLNSGTNLPAVSVPFDSSLQGAPAVGATYSQTPPPSATLKGANNETLTLGSGAVATNVDMAGGAAMSLDPASGQRVFLNLENIRGSAPSAVLNVWVGAPGQDGQPAPDPEFVKTVALFGLAKASADDGAHGGQGINVTLDVTDLAQRLTAAVGDGGVGQLVVWLQQPGLEDDSSPVQVERVSLSQLSPFSDA